MRPIGIVLASTSPYRRDLFARLRLPFESAAPAFDEGPLSDEPDVTPETARSIALSYAVGKAESLRSLYPRHLIIASDQVCECEGRALEKAGTVEKARAQLRHLSGRVHRLHTSVVLLDTANGIRRENVDVTTLWMRTLSEDEIDYYVRMERPLDSAGSYYSEALGVALFDAMETTDATAIVGLPLVTVRRLLAELGVHVLRPETWPGTPGASDDSRQEGSVSARGPESAREDESALRIESSEGQTGGLADRDSGAPGRGEPAREGEFPRGDRPS